MKIIHTADWHIGKILNERSLLEEQGPMLHAWVDEVKKIAPDAIIMAGDLYDRSLPSQEAVHLVHQILKRLALEVACPTLMISGNHDSGQRLAYLQELLAHFDLYIEGLPRQQVKRVTVKEADIYLFPYTDYGPLKALYPEEDIHSLPAGVAAQLATCRELWRPERLNLAVFHGYVTRHDLLAQEAGEDLVYSEQARPLTIGTQPYIPSAYFADFSYVALGHLHQCQQVGHAPMYYSGSPFSYSKAEAGQRKVYLEVDLEHDGVTVKKHPFPAKRTVKIARGSFKELLAQGSDDYVYLELTDEKPVHEAMARLLVAYPRALSLSYVQLAREREQVALHSKECLAKLSQESLFQRFYQEMTAQELTAYQEKLVRQAFQAAREEAK